MSRLPRRDCRPDQADLIPQHFCVRCGFDLRRAPKVSVKTAARRLERSIDDICRIEAAKGSLTIGTVVSRVLRAPVVAGVTSATSLTSLSTPARIRCFEQLAERSDDWLAPAGGNAVAQRRRLVRLSWLQATMID
ncbi:hypothetical protein [Mesorhizobium sp. M0435]|uniref:hypothetical protein n=1 Tax=Mesorhizobium sp. M0435 TaxID=2956944 RepID=UPI00333E0B60